MTPVEASKEENENKVWRNLYDPPERKTPKFSVGDKVRISKKKGIFEKGYTPKWTEEIFTISKIQYTDPITYKITDYNGEEIKGNFTNESYRKRRKKRSELRRLSGRREINLS